MAQVTKYVDDLDPTIDADHINVEIGLDGQRVEIDLSDEHYHQLIDALMPFKIAARKVRATETAAPTAARRGRTRTDSDGLGKEERDEIRRWAAQENLHCPERGRIPSRVLAAWNARNIDNEPADLRVGAGVVPFHAVTPDEYKQRLHAWCMTKGIPTNSKGRGTRHGVEISYIRKFQNETGVLPPVE